MITVSGVSQSFGGRTLFENLNVQFTPGKRYGLTRQNGAGISAFMKILQSDEEATSGTVRVPKKDEKIAVIGNNGVGKTTLLSMIAGVVELCCEVAIGYFPQDYKTGVALGFCVVFSCFAKFSRLN